MDHPGYHKRFKAGKWEYTIKRADLMDKPIYLREASEAHGDALAKNIIMLLDRGIVPQEYKPRDQVMTIAQLVDAYESEAHPSAKDLGVLGTIVKRWGKETVLRINVDWVDAWITELKQEDKLAPATIRAKIGAMSRCANWGVRKNYLLLPDSPFKTLPDGYSQYTKKDAAIAGEARVDVERDRRLEPGEHDLIMATLRHGVLHRKQRPLVLEHAPALICLFLLAQETAMRLREMYTLTLDQVNLEKRTVFLDKTKNGSKRQVPLTSVAMSALQDYLKVRAISGNQLFPWWDGTFDKKSLIKLSDYLSSLWVEIFTTAGCADLRFHDLRHEATSRMFERTTMRDIEIMQVTGHKSLKMLMRYANLRGSNLSQMMW